MTPRDPDELLHGINRSILLKALVASVLVHVVLIFGTSFGLYRDWAAFGLHTPSTIKQLKQKAAREASEEERRSAVAQRAEEAQVSATNAVPAAVATNAAVASPSSPSAAPTPTPVAPEVAPLPPKTSFTLGEDLSLD